MTALRSLASHLIAGATALAISLVMISSTVSNPIAQNADLAAVSTGILA